mmetsp:Transcript_29823/g.70883  ORF Transcript_29823/g.70883 Transcript_29823/m.70883 type:complete len:204 (+) Transcript_29823:439-1050(+)
MRRPRERGHHQRLGPLYVQAQVVDLRGCAEPLQDRRKAHRLDAAELGGSLAAHPLLVVRIALDKPAARAVEVELRHPLSLADRAHHEPARTLLGQRGVVVWVWLNAKAAPTVVPFERARVGGMDWVVGGEVDEEAAALAAEKLPHVLVLAKITVPCVGPVSLRLLELPVLEPHQWVRGVCDDTGVRRTELRRLCRKHRRSHDH